MSEQDEKGRAPGRASRRIRYDVTHLPTVLAILVVLAAGIYGESQNRVLHHAALRADVSDRLGLIRAKLEGNINGNIQLVRGVVSAVAQSPDMQPYQFHRLADHVMRSNSHLINIAAAPNLIIAMVHPTEGNEKVIGLDYRATPKQREAALRARDTKELVLAGPVDLIQGGRGFIGRFPVFIPDHDGTEYFWGLISAVINADDLYADSGLLDPALPIEIAIVGADATGANGRQFFGDPSVLESEPVKLDIVLPFGSWEISAIPQGGWDKVPPNTGLLRLLWMFAGLLVIGPTYWTGRLLRERRAHIRESQASQAELARLSRRLNLALESSRIGIWELNLETSELVWDDRMKELYGVALEGETHYAQDWEKTLHPADRQRALEEFEHSIEAGTTYRSQYRIRTPDGQSRTIRAIGAQHTDANGVRYVSGVNWDVSDDVEMQSRLESARWHAEARNDQLEAAKAKMEHNSLHDALTGLPNRRFLDHRLAELSQNARRTDRISVLHIDLDRFKQINDTLGHAAGDAMLIHAAGILRSHVRDSDFVARIGGDEFVVMCVSSGSDATVENLATRIIEEMRKPVDYEGNECRFGVSIGIAASSDPERDPRQLLVDADIALYRAKNLGRNRFETFTEELHAEIIETKQTADDIMKAIERNEMVPYFQPQFDATTLEIVGAEVLARWNHPTKGLLGPDAFLKPAEELNVIGTIDRMIFEQVLTQRSLWAAKGVEIPKIAVNVSASRLRDKELIGLIEDLEIKPGTISFELLESTFLDSSDELVSENIRRLAQLGVDIEIDDFGTGYASIVSLLQVQPRRLKIDRQLIMPIVETERSRQLVSSIVDIARSLGVETIAEGVETMEHARILRDLGCCDLQGYAFAPALTSEEFVAFASGRSWLKQAS